MTILDPIPTAAEADLAEQAAQVVDSDDPDIDYPHQTHRTRIFDVDDPDCIDVTSPTATNVGHQVAAVWPDPSPLDAWWHHVMTHTGR